MDNQEIIQKIQDLYASVPGALQKAIVSSDYQNKIVDIGKNNKLTVAQLGDLELVTTFVMLGATSPNNYKSEIAEKLGIQDEAVVDKIVDDVNAQIFSTIRDELKEINTPPEGEAEDDDSETFWHHSEEEMNAAGFQANNTAQTNTTSTQTVSAKDQAELEKSGIEIEKTRPTSEEYVKATVLPNSGLPASGLQTRENILNGIEHPTESKTSFIVKQFSGVYTMPTKETTYIPKPVAPAQTGATGKAAGPAPIPAPKAPLTDLPTNTAGEPPAKIDPYREII